MGENGLIDIHNHILPNLDDGSKSIEEAVKVAFIAAEYEIHKIVATPHYMKESFQVESSEVQNKVKEFNKILKKNNIDVEILSGHEIYMTTDLVKKIKSQKILSLNESRYILLEMPMSYIPNNLEQIFYDLRVLGYRPVVAHPERNEEVIKDPNILFNWVKDGIIFQLNAGSLFGIYGNLIKKTAFSLVENYLVQVIASDAHGCKEIEIDWLARARRKLKEICGRYAVQFFTNAEYIINDEEIIYEEPVHIKTKSIWNIFDQLNITDETS
ncbi:MAG: hypothetical protein K9K32_01455 [Halanaerobiales bacterium]|nr:hypothetical protein [Halanaerobiales bacterium]